jgi:hypothetical protein
MARSTSKQKGASFEREICKKMSLWISGGEREDCLWRSAMSGGRATVGRRAGKSHDHHAGDISATSPEGHRLTDAWFLECKFYRDLDIKAALVEGRGKLAQFWREACEQATAHHKMPMLIAKQNQTRVLLLTPIASHMNPSGLVQLKHANLIARLFTLRADVFCFDSVMRTDFGALNHEPAEKFLRPGELQRILSGKPSKKRATIDRTRNGKRKRKG